MFAVSSFFVVSFLQADGKDPLCHQLADGKEMAHGKVPDSSSDTMQFSCLGDWERVMHDGPWNFRGDAVILLLYDGSQGLPQLIWIQSKYGFKFTMYQNCMLI